MAQLFSAISFGISCLERSRMWFSERVDPQYLDYWPFEILTEKAILRIPLKKKNVGNANLQIYSADRWTLRASEVMSWFLQYSNLQHREKKR